MIEPSIASMMTKPQRMLIGTATKKTCNCGISFASTPSAGINREAEHQGTARRAESPRAKDDDTSRITSCAMSPVGRCAPGGIIR